MANMASIGSPEQLTVQYLPGTLKVLMVSGLLPAAFIAINLNLVLPEELGGDQTEEISGGHAKGNH